MFRLIGTIESRLLELREKENIEYTFSFVGENLYQLIPCPSNFRILENLSNVVWTRKEGDHLLIKMETLTAIEDLVISLNSTH
ncbi:hypothetical protein [Nostoc punctiforme]|nr:hypothetical protein [Nostoc punctiforme]